MAPFLSTKWFSNLGRKLFKPIKKVGELGKGFVKSIGDIIKNPRVLPKKIGELSRTIADPVANVSKMIEHMTGLPTAKVGEMASGVIKKVGEAGDAIDKIIN